MKEEEQLVELREFLERLKRLHEKDREGSARLEEAGKKATGVLRDSEEELAEVYLSIGDGVKKAVEKKKAELEKEVAGLRAKMNREVSKETKALERKAEKNRDEAIEFILSRVGAWDV